MTEHDGLPAREPIEVRRGSDSAAARPEQFIWRGRLFLVRSVLDHWVESGTWCLSAVPSGSGGAPSDPAGSHGGAPAGRVLAVLDLGQALVAYGDQVECWLVEAASGRHSARAVYELSCDLTRQQWSLTMGRDR